MIDFTDIFYNYDDYLLKNMIFEIRINNCKIATFYDIGEAEEYINIIYKEYNNFRWFVSSSNQTIVFDLYNKKVEEDE